MATKTFTIPKRVTKGEELVVISRKEYESFLKSQKKPHRGTQLDRDLDRAIKEVEQGKFIGPFKTAKEAVAALNKK